MTKGVKVRSESKVDLKDYELSSMSPEHADKLEELIDQIALAKAQEVLQEAIEDKASNFLHSDGSIGTLIPIQSDEHDTFFSVDFLEMIDEEIESHMEGHRDEEGWLDADGRVLFDKWRTILSTAVEKIDAALAKKGEPK